MINVDPFIGRPVSLSMTVDKSVLIVVSLFVPAFDCGSKNHSCSHVLIFLQVHDRFLEEIHQFRVDMPLTSLPALEQDTFTALITPFDCTHVSCCIQCAGIQ